MRTLLLLAVAALPAAAMDLFDFSDLRVGVDTVGNKYETTFNGSTADQDWDSATRYNADWVAGTSLILIGVAYGLGGTYDVRTSGVLDQTSTIGHVQVGPYLSLGPVQLELLGLAGIGTSKISNSSTEDTSSVDEYGINLGLTASLLHLTAGIRGGWLQQTADFDVSGGQSLRVKSNDYTAGAWVGWRF